MKKVLLIISALFLLSCSAANTANTRPAYASVSASSVDACSTPSEVHAVPGFRFPLTAQVVRHQNCMEVDDMLMIIFPGDASEKNLVAARLLSLMYTEHQNGQDQESVMTAKFIKADKVLREGITVQVAFYELITRPLEKKTNEL
jgi:hypothetical protein|tara:strand:- start:391 stop:825 length:435 start_codon:yes stop_codon:yes gene_type:complete